MKKRKRSSKYSFLRFAKKLPKLRSIAPVLFVMLISALLLGLRAYADSTNYFTGCIKNGGTHNLYNVQIGTSPTSPCNSGDSQISADYGDVTGITAGTGLSGGATQGAAVLSLADGGVTTIKLADGAVTTAKINSGSVSAGQILTADGSGGATWQVPASNGSSLTIVDSQNQVVGTYLDPYRIAFKIGNVGVWLSGVWAGGFPQPNGPLFVYYSSSDCTGTSYLDANDLINQAYITGAGNQITYPGEQSISQYNSYYNYDSGAGCISETSNGTGRWGVLTTAPLPSYVPPFSIQ